MKRNEIMNLAIAGNTICEALMEAFVPEEARRHFLVSRTEALKGLRTFLDVEIDKLEQLAAAKRKEQTNKRNAGRTIDITE